MFKASTEFDNSSEYVPKCKWKPIYEDVEGQRGRYK